MRALVCNEYGPPEKLVIEERPDPVPGAGEVLVGIKAAGINFPDVLTIAGTYQIKIPPPFVPGSEAAGIVEAVGEGVARVKPGDRVIVTPHGGGFAEKCVVAEKLCLPLPNALDFEQGAGFTVTYATSYHAFRQCTELKPGESVLVLGAAPARPCQAVEIAKALGAKVIAAASSEDKLQFARDAGADETINYSQVSLRDAVKEFTAGAGVDVVYDPVGGTYSEEALRSTGWRGRLLVVGFASGTIPKLPLNLALLNERSIVGVYWGESVARDPAAHARNVGQLLEWFAAGRIKPQISERVPLAGAVAARQRMTRREVVGKVVVLPGA